MSGGSEDGGWARRGAIREGFLEAAATRGGFRDAGRAGEKGRCAGQRDSRRRPAQSRDPEPQARWSAGVSTRRCGQNSRWAGRLVRNRGEGTWHLSGQGRTFAPSPRSLPCACGSGSFDGGSLPQHVSISCETHSGRKLGNPSQGVKSEGSSWTPALSSPRGTRVRVSGRIPR